MKEEIRIDSNLSASSDEGLTIGFTAPDITEASGDTPFVYDFDGEGHQGSHIPMEHLRMRPGPKPCF